MNSAGAPLQGIRVLEVCNYMAGPFCTMQLADLGADVIKIENPEGGDLVRHNGPFIDGESSPFVRFNRNKRSLALNLKATEGKEVFRRLAKQADIIVENMRPGTMADLELDYPRLATDNPGLIYVAASGWGQDGPYSQLPGLDIMAQGMSGLMSITGEPDGEPVKVGVPITDLVCALYGATAALAALNARQKDGQGQFIDVCLFESGVSLAIWEAGQYFATGEIPEPLGSAHRSSAPYQAIRSEDGYFTVGATSPRNWTSFCEVTGLQHLESDERFTQSYARLQHREELIGLIEEVTTGKPSAYWVERLQHAGVPCGTLQNYAQVFSDPHLVARDYFVDLPHPKLGPTRVLGSPMRLSRTPVKMQAAAPLLGQHSAEILAEFGYSQADIERLATQGVVFCHVERSETSATSAADSSRRSE